MEKDLQKQIDDFIYEYQQDGMLPSVAKEKINNLIYQETKEIINYIEKDAEIAIPINELMREDGTHLTKKEYGLVVLKYLVIELKEKFKKNNQNR